jgi:aminoglycoside phosphotransferase (APT) family kinase protein
MAQFTLAELPPSLKEHVAPHSRLTYPRQGMTSDVAFADHDGGSVVVKRCANPVYLDWLRREHVVLRALGATTLPIPRLIACSETETDGATVGWLVMSRLAGRTVLGAAVAASPRERVSLFRRLGELCGRLHAVPVPNELERQGSWLDLQLLAARGNLSWCDGTAEGLVALAASRPAAIAEKLIHGDLSLDNVLVAADGTMSLIDWAGGGPGDPRHDIALALQTKPELELSDAALAAFAAGYDGALPDAATRDWFVRLYDYF